MHQVRKVGAMSTDCTKCDGWGCRACLSLGEQSPSVDELREERLKKRVTELEAENGRLRMRLEIADRDLRR